ncbi:MAG: amidohydrolase family protein [Pseudomonadales bacterium]
MLVSKSLRLVSFALMCVAPVFYVSASASSYHFTNGHVVTMTGEGSRSAEVLVTSDRIVAIGSNLPIPADTISINLEGGYLMPGLAEMHAHVPATSQGQQYRDDVLFLYLANGITTIRGMLGVPAHLELKESLISREVLGPRLITSGPSFNGNSVSSPKQAARMVEAQFQAGYDFLKIHPGVKLDEYDAIVATAKRLGIPFAGHVPAEVGLLHALSSGQATIDHLDGYVQALVPGLNNETSGIFAFGLTPRADTDQITAVVTATRKAGSAVVPTQTLLENFAAVGNLEKVIKRPQNVYLPPQLLKNYTRRLSANGSGLTPRSAARFLELRNRLIRELHGGGVRLLLGSDAPQVFNVPGFSAHRELGALVDAGLNPFEALLTGTRNPAEFFGMGTEFGTLEIGTSADMVWLRADPQLDIDNTTSIQGVMVRGLWLDRSSLDTGLREIADRYAQ